MKVMVAIPSALLSRAQNSAPKRRDGPTAAEYLFSFKFLVDSLRHAGVEVYCYMDELDWKKPYSDNVADAVRLDLTQIKECDHFIACPRIGRIVSTGVALELGWATALGKPVTILAHHGHNGISFMLKGLASLNSEGVPPQPLHEHFSIILFSRLPGESIRKLLADLGIRHNPMIERVL